MKAAIYNPYLDTLGGGERYTLSFAKVLAEELGYEVCIEWPNINIREKLEKRFGLKISKSINFVNDVNRGEGYDLIFWVSDGSIPMLKARKNILHFQVPFKDVNGKSLINKMKLFRINKIICNSNFTKKIIDQEYGVNSIVLYPAVDTNKFKAKRKENIILYVGRFSNLVQNKNHAILISAFKKLLKVRIFKDWKLVFVGGVEVGVGNYLNRLKKMSINYPIEFIESPDFDKLVDVFGRAKIFWSAAGYEIDENKNPEKVEHFGITVVEAMSAGCIPLIIKVGGGLEIIEDGKNGFYWSSKNDLINKTGEILDGNLKRLSNAAIERSSEFDYASFSRNLCEILKS